MPKIHIDMLSLELQYPIWQSVILSGYWSLHVWLILIEMGYKYKIYVGSQKWFKKECISH